MRQEFQGKLIGRGPKGAWTHMIVPFRAEQAFGSRARVAVRGTINEVPFRTSIMPEGDGSHYMAVTKELQAAAGVVAGDIVQVVMEIDPEERTVAVPRDLEAKLRQEPQAEAIFHRLAYSYRKEFVGWIEGAKREETRVRRLEKTVRMLIDGKRFGE